MATDPSVPTNELLRRATEEGYEGGKSAFYALVANEREPSRLPHRRNPLPGEHSHHDVVEVPVLSVDGTRRKARLFVTRLEFSRYVVVSVMHESGIETFARTLVEHFTRIGGVPLLATFDARRFGPTQPFGDARPLAHLALDLGLGIDLVEPPKSRASSSRISRMIKDELSLPTAPVHGEADFAHQIELYTTERNARPSEETGRTPLSMLVDERRRLRPLKVSLADLTVRFPIVVQANGMVLHEGREYALSPLAAGSSGTLFLGAHQIRIVAGTFSATFARFFAPSRIDVRSA